METDKGYNVLEQVGWVARWMGLLVMLGSGKCRKKRNKGFSFARRSLPRKGTEQVGITRKE